jgi:hypothetical protein
LAHAIRSSSATAPDINSKAGFTRIDSVSCNGRKPDGVSLLMIDRGNCSAKDCQAAAISAEA